MASIENYLVTEGPSRIYYIPNFISESEEEQLIKHVNSVPKPKWTQLSNRRLQNWGGLPHPKGMISEQIPKWLKDLMDKVEKLEVFENNPPNHVLINEYLPGQGIMPHEDGPLFYPTITTVNVGSHTVLDLYQMKKNEDEHNIKIEGEDENPKTKPDGHLLLERRSLLILQKEAYDSYLHGIQEVFSDTIDEGNYLNLNQTQNHLGDILERKTRISFTIRNVPKVLKSKIFLGR